MLARETSGRPAPRRAPAQPGSARLHRHDAGRRSSRHHPPRVMAGPPVRRTTMEDAIRSRLGMMAVYDLLAPHYDAVTGDSASEAAFIHDLIGGATLRPSRCLTWPAGRAASTALLAGASGKRAGYIAGHAGRSPGKAAQRDCLYLADMTSFRLGASFDVIVCAYQGINHLLSLAAWKDSFDRAYGHLNRGGLFIFDVITVSHLDQLEAVRIVQEFAGIPADTGQQVDGEVQLAHRGVSAPARRQVQAAHPDRRAQIISAG